MLRYLRNKLVTVEREDGDVLRVHGALEDDMYGLELDLKITVDQLEILSIEGKWNRWTTPECPRATSMLAGAVGFSILDDDFHQAVQLEIGRKACRHFANLMMECCLTAKEAAGQIRRVREQKTNGKPVALESSGNAPKPSGKSVSGSQFRSPANADSGRETHRNFGRETVIDLHVHTSPASPCSSAPVDDLIVEAKRIGLDGICLTDHNHLWRPEDTEALSQRHGFLVIRGNEITTDQGDILVFGLEEDIREIIRLEVLREKVRRAGGFMIAAHPFRGFLVFGTGELGLTPERAGEKALFRQVDAVEVLNGKVTEKENNLAFQVAEGLGLQITGGSDAHEVPEVGLCATRFPGKIRTESDLIAAFREGGFGPVAYRKKTGSSVMGDREA